MAQDQRPRAIMTAKGSMYNQNHYKQFFTYLLTGSYAKFEPGLWILLDHN